MVQKYKSDSYHIGANYHGTLYSLFSIVLNCNVMKLTTSPAAKVVHFWVFAVFPSQCD